MSLGTTTVQIFGSNDNLAINPLRAQDLGDYQKIIGDAEVRQWLGDGTITPAEKAAELIKSWERRWESGSFFTAYSVRLSNHAFVGLIYLLPDSPGSAELIAMFVKTQQSRGHGSLAAAAFLYKYVPTLIQKKYHADGVPLKKIVATARTDNIRTKKILEMLGMTCTHKAVKWGKMRLHFMLNLNDVDYQVRCLIFSLLKSAKPVSLISEYVPEIKSRISAL